MTKITATLIEKKLKLRIPFRIFIIGNLIREIKATTPRCFLWVSELIKLLETAGFAAGSIFYALSGGLRPPRKFQPYPAEHY